MSPKFLIIDLFCGAGGVTTGFAMTNGIAKVIACVNHDAKAIESHWKNHPDVVHYEEDIRTLELSGLVELTRRAQAEYPEAKLILWASLECTNFSKAKGGQPRDADSRTLAESLYMHYDAVSNTYYEGDSYMQLLQPDYLMIENVVEFMSWGPLDEKGKPLSRKNGQDFMRWCNVIDSLGYRNEWKELNSANFGAYTSRNRLFGCFAKDGMPIAWPVATHSKKASGGMFGGLKPWKAVKDVLDFADEGNSIFERDKPLSEKTLERIYAGLIKYVAGGQTNYLAKIYAVASNSHGTYTTESAAHTITTRDAHALVQGNFIVQRNGGDPNSKVASIESPARTLTATGGNLQIVHPAFLTNYYGSGGQLSSIEKPSGTITTKARQAIVNPQYLVNYHHSSNVNDINTPCPTLTTRDKLSLIKPVPFISRNFTGGGQHSSIDAPAGALLSVPKINLVQAFIMPTNFDNKPHSIEEPHKTITADRHWSYLVNPAWGGHPTNTDVPCPVIVARQDKAPLYIVCAEGGSVGIRIDENDSECTRKIKEFMVLYNIIDIKMRMLKVSELLKIQGFPDGYKLAGNQSDQKKFIGNSVVPIVPKVWIEAMGEQFVNDDVLVA